MVDVNHIAALYIDLSSNNLKEFKMNSTATIQNVSANFSPSALLVPLALAAVAVLAMSFSSTSSNTAPQGSSLQAQQVLSEAPTIAPQAEALELDNESPRSCCDQSQ
jgi:hypothetical protein